MSGTRRRPCGRLLAAAVVLAGAISAVLVSSTAFAAEPEDQADGPSILAAGVDPSGVGDLVAALALRAEQAAVALAVEATPAPPPRVHCPVPGSEFVDSWGFARSGGRRHEGVDMMAPYGAPVLAPVAGTVRASNSALGGIGFYLDDAEGNQYFGSHLASLDVIGPVEAGTRIGTVGSSGNAGTPHLHLEIAPGGGAAMNPYPFALAWCTQDPEDPWVDVPRP